MNSGALFFFLTDKRKWRPCPVRGIYHGCFYFGSLYVNMELLSHFGVSCELLKDAFVRRLRCDNSEQQICQLRLALIEDAVQKSLADSGDALVKRKKTSAGKSVNEKHIDDIWCLAGAIKRCESVPRVLLRNGKRRKEELLKSQAMTREKREADCASDVAPVTVSAVHSSAVHSNGNTTTDCDGFAGVSNATSTAMNQSQNPSDHPLENPSDQPSEFSPSNQPVSPSDISENPSVFMKPSNVFLAKMIESVNILREDVNALRTELRALKTTTLTTITTQNKCCSLYVRLDGRGSDDHVGKSLLESLLECTVSQYACLMGTPSPSFKVKVLESDAQSVLAAGAKPGCFVARWSNRSRNGCCSATSPPPPPPPVSPCDEEVI